MERLLDESLLPLLSQPPLGSLWDSLRYDLGWQLGECGVEAVLLKAPGSVSPVHPRTWPFRSLRKPTFPAGATLSTLRDMNTALHSRARLALTDQSPLSISVLPAGTAPRSAIRCPVLPPLKLSPALCRWAVQEAVPLSVWLAQPHPFHSSLPFSLSSTFWSRATKGSVDR